MKRTTETVLRGELAAARKEYGAAIARRDEAKTKVDAATRILAERSSGVEHARQRSDRAVATLEAYLGEKLPAETESAP